MPRTAAAPSRPRALPVARHGTAGAIARARRRGAPAAAWLLGAALAVAGCAQTAPLRPSTPPAAAADGAGKTANQSKAVPSQFSDLPIPQGAKLNVDKTLVVGTQTWYGQLSLDTSHNADTMFDFYSRELANYGWRRIAAVRAPTSILTYDRDQRVLAIAITPSRVYGSEITITVSPREETMPAMPGGPAGAAVGPGAGGPMGGQMGGPMGGPGGGDGGPVMPPPVRQIK